MFEPLAPNLKMLVISCQPTLLFGVVLLTQGPVSAITLPPVTTPAETVALNHRLTPLLLVVGPGPVLPWGLCRAYGLLCRSSTPAECSSPADRRSYRHCAGERVAGETIEIARPEKHAGAAPEQGRDVRRLGTDPRHEAGKRPGGGAGGGRNAAPKASRGGVDPTRPHRLVVRIVVGRAGIASRRKIVIGGQQNAAAADQIDHVADRRRGDDPLASAVYDAPNV